jgi:UDP-N-acetylglucosamine 2-epimerase
LRGHDVLARPNGARVAIILGDRSEMLTVARECIEAYVPYVHVGAGCITRGSWDQGVRDMLTAGAEECWAYTSMADAYHNTTFGMWGVPVLDTLAPSGWSRQNDYVLVALNPVTAHSVGEEHLLARVIASACREVNILAVWSTPNEDRPGADLQRTLEAVWPGQQLKISFRTALEMCRCIVGNSSSALIEAPVLGTPYVDVGCRQQGRPLAQSLYGVDQIIEGIKFHEPHVGDSPYRSPTRSACREIIELAERVGA